MKSRIVIPNSLLVLCTQEEREESERVARRLIEAGGTGENFDYLETDARVTIFEGPDEEVRALTNQLMGLIHKYK